MYEGAETVRELLKVAKESIPPTHWEKTPVVLKATAGLRLLPEEKSQALLSEVKEIFEESPFLVPDESVSIMNGTYEGILAWITINFLTARLHNTNRGPVGTLDLGGASTQITFLPQSQNTVLEAPENYLSSFEMFNRTYRLYTHSYLGFGLKVARLAVLGALDRHEKGHIYSSSCLPKGTRATWMFGGSTYRYGGDEKGVTGFQTCYSEVAKVVRGNLHQPEEIASSTFYAFSYYYDRAVDTGLIDNERGGVIEVKDFERKAKEVCNNLTNYKRASPFLCMDLSYITALLKEGFGFHEDSIIRLSKKVNNVEASWALGATFHLLQSLKSQH
ncbi:ectonucleoside triphosphate diphosphohydrolase 5-like [Protopterus annectens]|uniref:ectonucleoside triphosphate diphosphohydrolase 5-like n=1 Tax=Protopterus annectens TaxID=7888 RepID=UPI001CF9BF4D|nr:ectonucleoside triphosphate diphosphohydrolase 5-like [Protopterus annectens]